MRVGREVDRQVVLDVRTVAIQLGKKPPPEFLHHAVADQVENPNPRKCPEPDFQGAAPVDPTLKRILSPPLFDVLEDAVAVLLAAGKSRCLRKQHEMLVPVQLPDELVVPNCREIQVGNSAEVLRRGLGTVIDNLPQNGYAAAQNLIRNGGKLTDVI